jgi:uncharacterized protein YjlB
MVRVALFLTSIVYFFLVATPCTALLSSTTNGDNNNKMQKVSCAAQRAWGTIEKQQTSPAPFDIFRLFMDDDGTFPNNPRYPLLLYKAAFSGSQADGQHVITKGREWTSPWAWGVFPYHHYHSRAWELLLCVRGEANVQLGGECGPTIRIENGDLVLIPPGFAHKQLEASSGFTLLGSYPTQGWSGSIDALTGAPTQEERDNIAACPIPARDPVFGLNIGELCDCETSATYVV